MKLRRRIVLLGLICVGFAICWERGVAEGSVLNGEVFHLGNGGILSGRASAIYSGAGGIRTDSKPANGLVASSDVSEGATFQYFAPAIAIQLPDSGDPKDAAGLTNSCLLTIGDSVNPDIFLVNIDGYASASNSMVNGMPADASLSGFAALTLRFDAAPEGTPLGTMQFDAVRPLLPFETLAAWSVTLDPVGSGTGSGPVALDPSGPITFMSGHVYELRFSYAATVPFGSDPPFSIQAGATMTAVPEPSAPSILAIGLLALGGVALVQKRRKQPGVIVAL